MIEFLNGLHVRAKFHENQKWSRFFLLIWHGMTHKLYSTEIQTSLSLSLVHKARLIYTPEHRHAAGLRFKGRVICFYSCFATQAGC